MRVMIYLVKSINKKQQIRALQLVPSSRSPDLVEKLDAVNMAEKLGVKETDFLRNLLRLELNQWAITLTSQRGHHTLHSNQLDAFLPRGLSSNIVITTFHDNNLLICTHLIRSKLLNVMTNGPKVM